MPRISEFFALIIYMYWFDTQKHKIPHFHVRYSGKEAIFDFSGKCIEGDIGRRGNRLIAEWCNEKKEEIEISWECAIQGKEMPWVSPLQ